MTAADGGPAGPPVAFSGRVADTTREPAVPVTTGTVSLYDNGSANAFAAELS
jgi:hypothetical protein